MTSSTPPAALPSPYPHGGNVAHDLLLVYSSVQGRMWDGDANSVTFYKGVAGSDYNFPGEMLCTSGSVSRAICNYQTGENFQFGYWGKDVYEHDEWYDDLLLAVQRDGRTAALPGDSGGPVFSLSGSNRVIAEGVISGVHNENTLIFQDFLTAQRDFGINVLTD
ncbi:hypothetical protein ACFQ1S_30025 [Kibdelosporangium lantanae]|uniref:Peptidase S1 domain-containing protein n=1 Tax=Kibdelosporangium lantanae TaxID=1497396 RepID=A0ABW3MG48_9PSEU